MDGREPAGCFEPLGFPHARTPRVSLDIQQWNLRKERKKTLGQEDRHTRKPGFPGFQKLDGTFSLPENGKPSDPQHAVFRASDQAHKTQTGKF